MNPKLKTGLTVTGIFFALFLMWYFSTLTGYLLGSGVLAMTVSPFMEFLAKRKIGKKYIPRWLASIITLGMVIFIFFGFLFLVVPLISKEAQAIAQIDTQAISTYFSHTVNQIQVFLQDQGLLEQVHTAGLKIIEKVKTMLNIQNIGMVFSNIITFISSFFMAVFSILFITFFLLKDKALFLNLFMSIFPKKYQGKTTHVLSKTKDLLTRYFVGLLIQISIVMVLEILGLWILNVPNMILIGFIGGILNIIPYIGPLIGGTIGIILAVISTLSLGIYDNIEWVILKVVIVFGVANLIDNMVSQPLIFSKSVNAHPIEIFVVTLAAGYLGGIPAMIIAIPTYTVLRIILREYLSEFAFINNLTNMSSDSAGSTSASQS